jgi:hypothetical protein
MRWWLIGGMVVGGVGVLWSLVGRYFCLVLDRFFLVKDAELGTEPVEVRDGEIVVGDRKWPIRREGVEFPARREAGDEISMTRWRSRLRWVKLFEINWLGGSTSRWRRHLYDRLVWKKAAGPTLVIVWRHEERFYRGSGWADQWNHRQIWARVTK